MKAPLGKNQPSPPPPEEKEYEVVGPHAVHGASPGETKKLALSPEREKALVEGGHLKPVPPTPAKAVQDSPSKPRASHQAKATTDDGAKGAK